MPKKYLIYVHDDVRFELEKNKSGLINELLDRHYDTAPERTTLFVRTERKTCKNGHNLDKRGFNCSDKECKYGK